MIDAIPVSYLLASLGILLMLSAFFSSSETALMAVNRYRLRHLANQGHKGAQLAQSLLAKPDRLIGVILLGNNLVNILAASLAPFIGLRLYGQWGLVGAPFVLTILILIFSEVAPKTWAAVRPESIAYPASPILAVLLKIFYPVVVAINAAANFLLKPFGMHTFDRSDNLTREELKTMLAESGARMGEANFQNMMLNLLDLEQVTVSDVMVPRNEMVCVDLQSNLKDILEQITNTYYTRLPVYEGDIDNILGILHVRTILHRLAENDLTIDSIRRTVRKPYYIPETTPLTKQLLEFQDRERRMGLVVDEYGDIQGLLTLDDILEEIVGEFTTEPGARTRRVYRDKQGRYIVSGAESVRSLNRRLGWVLPTTGARTLNGLMLEHLETMPTAGTSIRLNDLVLTIEEIEDTAIKTIAVTRLHSAAGGADD